MFTHTVCTPVLLQPIISFCCSVWCWKVLHAVIRRTLSRGKCIDSCGDGCANWESHQLWGARCYLFSAGWWDLRLSCQKGKFSCGIVLLHDNTRPHTAQQTQALLHEQIHWDIFKHPPYSSDLAPSDFFLFPKMKGHLADKCFANDEDLKDVGWITRRSYGMKRVYTNWCQGTTNALMSMRLCWKVDKDMCQNLYIQFLYYY